MPVIVLLELMERTDAHIIQASEEPVEASAVRQVHAAPSDPDVPGDPGPTTACGRDTAAMLVEHWQSTGRWYPPRWAGWICPTCDTAVRSS
ncbi:hypothetical protein [Kitasatospora cathayae]|uniref:Uncharacterized protein n=1 Tax=Kitasatospora cathayae TaxID=3004092 RepID=A0ABY7QHB2_9ACTN|nr:hypothetical protein [Kitasatospora sp. HUAS 3-15]WBP92218.1 hypothetical protein O1G21_41150 [Kitasatospora sp. HUAS 3-15]